MDYIDGTVDAPFDTAESQDEAAAEHQMQMDILYRIGNQYGVANADMAAICQLANINFNELLNYSGATA